PFQTPKGRRRVSFVAVSLLVLYFMLTVGAHGVAAIGVGVAKPPKAATNTVYLGVRTDLDELRSSAVITEIEDAGVTIIVDGRNRDPIALATALEDFTARAEAAGLTVRSLQDLR